MVQLAALLQNRSCFGCVRADDLYPVQVLGEREHVLPVLHAPFVTECDHVRVDVRPQAAGWGRHRSQRALARIYNVILLY